MIKDQIKILEAQIKECEQEIYNCSFLLDRSSDSKGMSINENIARIWRRIGREDFPSSSYCSQVCNEEEFDFIKRCTRLVEREHLLECARQGKDVLIERLTMK